MRLVILAISFICLILSNLSAQTDSIRGDYALLWEISGNGLEKPSYLFGSMHIRQDFAFEFPDSLLYYLSHCDAFANEVHLDSAMLRLFEVYIGEEELQTDSSYIAFIQTKKVQVDSSTIANKNSFEGLFSNLIDKEEEEDQYNTGGTKPTMLDAYLMNIARGLGKQLYGLERIDNHLYESEGVDKIGSGFSLFNTSYQDLEKQYYLGSLSGIQKIIQTEASSFDGLELIPRNYIMVESMLRIMTNQSLFSVVGAAHLPGKEGVIELLRAKGFQLRKVLPVFSDSEILTADFAKKNKKRPWPSVNKEGANFKLSTPLPYVFKSNLPFESTYLQADVGKGLFYLLLTSSMTPNDYNDFDEYFFENDGYQIINKSPYSLNGLTGHRYKLEKIGEDITNFMGYVFIENGELYYLQVGAYEAETFNESTDPNIFIDNFSIKEAYPGKWHLFDDSRGAFKVNIPRHTYYRVSAEDVSRKTDKTISYSAGFNGTQSSIWLKYFDISIESQEQSDSLAFLAEIKGIEDHLGIELEITDKSLSKWSFTGLFPYKKLIVNGFLRRRGNRLYSLYSIDKKGFQHTKKFLKSFQFIPYDSSKFDKSSYLIDSLFQSHIPSDFTENQIYLYQHQVSPIISEYQVDAKDPNSGAKYEVLVEKIHPLFGTSKASSYLLEKALGYDREGWIIFDKMVEKENTSFPELSLTKNSINSHYGIKKQIYIAGDYIITKNVYADSSYFSSPACKQFFEEDQWSDAYQKTPSLLTSKGGAIIDLLVAQDTSHWADINKAIDPEFSFDDHHFTPLKEVLINTKWSDSNISFSLQRKLLSALTMLNNSDILNTLTEIFKSVPLESYLRVGIMTHLIEKGSAGDQLFSDAFFELLLSDEKLSSSLEEFVFDPFYANPSLFIENIDHVKKALEIEKDHKALWEIAAYVFNENKEGQQAVSSIISSFTKRGEKRLSNYDDSTEAALPYYIISLYQLFPENKVIIEQLERLQNRDKIDKLNVEAIRFFLNKGTDIPKATFKPLLDHSNTWLSMIRLLNEYGLLNDIKNKYYSRSEVAKALLVNKMRLDGAVPTNIEMTQSIQLQYDGKPRLFYVFSFSLDGEPSRLGVVGLFSTDQKERHFIDRANVSYTDYPVTKRRRTRKAKNLAQELIDEGDPYGVIRIGF